MKELLYLKKYFIKYKKRLLVGSVFVILSNIFKVWSPQFLGDAVDLISNNLELFTNDSANTAAKDSISKTIMNFVLIYFVIALVSGLFTFLMRQSIIVMSRLIENDLRNEIYTQYQVLDQSFYKQNNTGDLMNRATEDVSKVRMFLGPAVMYTINVIMLFSFIIYSMLQINVSLTFWVLLPMPFLIFSIYKVQSYINIRSKKIQEKLSDLTSQAQEFYSGIRVLKSFVQEKYAKDVYKINSEEYKIESLKLARIEALFFPLMVLLIGLSTVLVIFIGGIKMNEGLISPGDILKFVFYVNMLTWPISSVGWVATLIQSAAASQKRINDFLTTKSSIVNNSKANFDFDGSISFNNVDFTYKDTGVNALSNISFEIKKGERWAIMGKTGAGKTSLVELISRLYDVTEGEIKVSQQHLKDVKVSNLRSQIGYVPQDVFLFSNTIEKNIKFSNTDFSKEKVMTISKKVAVHDEIMKFPLAYQTIVGERGVTLSGGQKQRVAMARAMIKEPNLFIFDDSFSALDTKTEKSIFGNIEPYLKDKTVLIITHRIPVHFQFDKILILEDGKILELGTHDELMEQNNYYSNIYKKQMKL
ncbi:MAG: ATP-binding cassette subfamily B multidrug efflux pump [Planctomycetota bacterium]